MEKNEKTSSGGTDRRTFLSQLGLAAGALTLGFPRIAEATTSDIAYAPTTPPNILIIMVDQLRYKELSQLAVTGTAFPGLSTVLPNITALQAQSVKFSKFFVAATTCTPSRAAFMTGLYPPQSCMYITQGNGAAPSMNTGFPTFASYLSNISGLGYQTAFYGKWHLSNFSDDFGDGSLNSYGFTITGNETPSPDGLANEGMTGGTFANPPHQSADGIWINDQQIVKNFAVGLGAELANQSPPIPWCAVVSLINPHDIANYPLYLLDYCTITAVNAPIQPYYAPQTPGALPTWAVTGTPDLPDQYELFTYSPQTNLPSCLGGVTAFSTYTSIVGITGPNIPPTNTSEQQGYPKPTLQQLWQDSIFSLNGSVQLPVSGPPYDNGDWGQYLNVYYWLAACADQLIGNLATPDSHIVVHSDSSYTHCTILGQVAALLGSGSSLTPTQKTALANTVIVFTADHGELGGAHSLPQKHACSYDEAINVPLFVSLPGQNTNTVRTQLVSSVDFFGLICGLAQPTYNGDGVPTWQAASPQLSTRTDMIACLKHNGYSPTNRTISIGGVTTPYIFHAYNEWFKDPSSQTPWEASDPCHVLCLRTATQKLVYYDTWATGYTTATEQQSAYNPEDYDTTNISTYAAKWSKVNGEYYALSSNPAETGNAFSNSSPLLDIQTNFMSCVSNELQLAVPSFATARAAAKAAFQNYITLPTATAVTNATGGTTITHSMTPQTINVTGGNVGAGPTVVITPSGGSPVKYPIDDDVSVSGAFPVNNVALGVSGPYTLAIINPSGLSSTVLNFTVS